MENASNALLIAASVLIGVLILSVAVVLYTTFGGMADEYKVKMEVQEMQEFNAKFTVYERSNLRAQDVLALAGIVDEWNKTGTNESIEMSVQTITKGNRNYDYIIKNYDDFLNESLENTNTEYPQYTMQITARYESGRIQTIVVKRNL